MTEHQAISLSKLLKEQIDMHACLHHGACIGVDEFTAVKARSLGYWVIAHPPINDKFLSTPAINISNEVLKEKEYLDRNCDIVEASDVLIAVSGGIGEVLRSGTWSTIRYADKLKKEIHIIYPNGEVEQRN